jgi:hypothetical protein
MRSFLEFENYERKPLGTAAGYDLVLLIQFTEHYPEHVVVVWQKKEIIGQCRHSLQRLGIHHWNDIAVQIIPDEREPVIIDSYYGRRRGFRPLILQAINRVAEIHFGGDPRPSHWQLTADYTGRTQERDEQDHNRNGSFSPD